MKKLNLIFLSTIFLILILGTTSFASVELSYESSSKILDYFKNNLCARYGTPNSGVPSDDILNKSKQLLSNTNPASFANFFNLKFNEAVRERYSGSYDFNNLTILGSTYNSDIVYLYFILSNNTAGDNNLSYMKFKYYPGFPNSIYLSDNNGTFLNGVLIKISNDNIFDISSVKVANYITSVDKIIIDETDTKIFYKPMLSLSPTQICYYNEKSYFLSNYINLVPPIDIPSGDPSGDTSGDQSGDTGGDTGGGTTTPDYNNKLDNIQGSLNNIQNSIPTSGDIAGATNQGNKDYWGDTEQMNGEDYENQINQGINDSMDKITGELEQNKTYNSIAIAEQKIIDLFLEKPEDFKISWQEVKYLEKTLIPAGEINFSKMCRDNEVLGRVKNTLNIIVSAMISLSLFKYIFNLIMVTLGIDHPLILETERDDITEISSTKIGNKTYVTKKTYKSDKKGGR